MIRLPACVVRLVKNELIYNGLPVSQKQEAVVRRCFVKMVVLKDWQSWPLPNFEEHHL